MGADCGGQPFPALRLLVLHGRQGGGVRHQFAALASRPAGGRGRGRRAPAGGRGVERGRRASRGGRQSRQAVLGRSEILQRSPPTMLAKPQRACGAPVGKRGATSSPRLPARGEMTALSPTDQQSKGWKTEERRGGGSPASTPWNPSPPTRRLGSLPPSFLFSAKWPFRDGIFTLQAAVFLFPEEAVVGGGGGGERRESCNKSFAVNPLAAESKRIASSNQCGGRGGRDRLPLPALACPAYSRPSSPSRHHPRELESQPEISGQEERDKRKEK